MNNEVRTPIAADQLGCSTDHLKRSRDIHGGPLLAGKHYRLGRSSNSAILWDVEAIKKTFHHHGDLVRRSRNDQTNLEAMQTWVNSLGDKDFGHLLQLCYERKSKQLTMKE